MSVGDKLNALTGDLDDFLDNTASKAPGKAKTAPGQLMQFSAELQAYQTRIAELEAKLADAETHTVRVELIDPNPWQPRKEFDPELLAELAASIKDVGLIQPVVLRRAGDRYQLVAGERRWRAHQMLGFEEIKVVFTDAADQDMYVLALTENIGRANLSHYEIYKSIRSGESQFKSRKVMASSLGLSRARFYHYLEFEKLPAIVLEDLEGKPSLLGADAAVSIVKVLAEFGDRAAEVFRRVWDLFKSGGVDQSKIAPLVRRGVESGSETPKSGRELRKFWVGSEQAATITKDDAVFAIKVKTHLLSPEKEMQIRELMASLFSEQPEKTKSV